MLLTNPGAFLEKIRTEVLLFIKIGTQSTSPVTDQYRFSFLFETNTEVLISALKIHDWIYRFQIFLHVVLNALYTGLSTPEEISECDN